MVECGFLNSTGGNRQRRISYVRNRVHFGGEYDTK